MQCETIIKKEKSVQVDFNFVGIRQILSCVYDCLRFAISFLQCPWPGRINLTFVHNGQPNLYICIVLFTVKESIVPPPYCGNKNNRTKWFYSVNLIKKAFALILVIRIGNTFSFLLYLFCTLLLLIKLYRIIHDTHFKYWMFTCALTMYADDLHVYLLNFTEKNCLFSWIITETRNCTMVHARN